MPSIISWARFGVIMLLMVGVHSCAPRMATTRGMTAATGVSHPGYGLQDAFMRDPPACVVVLPAKTPGRPEIATRDVEASVERFLATRFDRVLAGAYRDRQARHLALDLARPEDLGIFAARTKCHHALSVTIGGGGLSYAVVWAERRVGLALRLTRIGDDEIPLWWARDGGARGDGGLPLSPLGIAGALFRAGRVAGDQGQGISLLDDVLRRMMRSLPDVRGLAYSAAYPARLSMNSTVMPSGSRR